MEAQILQCIENTKRQIDLCERILNPAGTILECCPCIVATADGGYQVAVDENNKATVSIGNYTNVCQFTPKTAKRIASDFYAANGFGPLKWVVMSSKEFYAIRKANLEASLKALEWGLNRYRTIHA